MGQLAHHCSSPAGQSQPSPPPPPCRLPPPASRWRPVLLPDPAFGDAQRHPDLSLSLTRNLSPPLALSLSPAEHHHRCPSLPSRPQPTPCLPSRATAPPRRRGPIHRSKRARDTLLRRHCLRLQRRPPEGAAIDLSPAGRPRALRAPVLLPMRPPLFPLSPLC